MNKDLFVLQALAGGMSPVVSSDFTLSPSYVGAHSHHHFSSYQLENIYINTLDFDCIIKSNILKFMDQYEVVGFLYLFFTVKCYMVLHFYSHLKG